MATVLGDCTIEEQRCLCVLPGQNDSMQKIFTKKCFPFTVGSVYRVKRFTTWWQTFRWWRRGWNRGAEVAETTVKTLLSCAFRRTGKAMGQVYQCCWRICRETNAFLSRFEYHMFYVLYPFVTYLLSLPRTMPVKNLTEGLFNLYYLCISYSFKLQQVDGISVCWRSSEFLVTWPWLVGECTGLIFCE
jgi:hypothetical protein